MAIASRRPLATACAMALLAGCAGPPVQAPATPRAARVDPANDWRRLPIASFGSLLQDLQMPVHEVLMFGDLASQECYGLDAPQGRFVGRQIETYLVCFAKGRLDRVEVTVNLAVADAAADFSRYCDDWLQHTVAGSGRTGTRCSGTAPQGESFSASLLESDEAGQESVPLSIVIADAPVPDSP
jgi:hypothetical protein